MRRRAKKRSGRRRRPRKNGPSKLPGLPNMLSVNLRYYWTLDDTLDVGNSYQISNIFRANGPYDPDGTGVGSQPIGYDELSNIYSYVRVSSADIIFKCSTETAVTTAPYVRLLMIPNIASALASMVYENMAAMPFVKTGFCNTYKPGELRRSYDPLEVFPIPRLNPGLRTAVGANPTYQEFVWVVADNALAAQDAVVHMQVWITFHCVFDTLKVLTLS